MLDPSSRPTICRAFPFYFDLFAGLSMVEACPGVGGEPQKVADLQEEIRAATDMYRFWLEEILPTIA
jgi:Fe-S-cluster containining protein